MSQDTPQESFESSATTGRQAADGNTGNDAASGEPKRQPATVIVRGEMAQNEGKQPSANGSKSGDGKSDGDKSPAKPVSAAKVQQQSRLPALADDAEIGVSKQQVVTRDGKADLAFTGKLLASAAPSTAPKGKWQEYRVYATDGGKHVFSKASCSIYADEQDTHEADVFDPSPASMPSALLRSARDLTRSHPVTWTDAAASFFGYDPLAKDLYRKLGSQFEEHIS